MADIICAQCGEPWDSTGGLHHTHADVGTPEDYWLLVFGFKCPCCRENHRANGKLNGEVALHYVRRWQRSIEHLSEGHPDFMFESFDKLPLMFLPPENDPFCVTFEKLTKG